VESVIGRDFTITQAVVVLTTVLAMTVKLIVDLLDAWLNPRIRYV
jgi:ABC-type dipeptide/oligopeptide/nickel transport system permease component